MNKKSLCFLLTISIMVTMLFGCTGNNKNINSDKTPQVSETTTVINDDATDVSDYKKHSPITSIGFVLGLSDEKNNTYKESSINVEPLKDFKVSVDATYTVTPTSNAIDYAITAYIDYKQIEFSVGNSTAKVKKYTSKAKDNISNKISITLPTSSLSGSHKLTIVSQCNNYIGQSLMADSFCKNFNLTIGKETDYEIKDKLTKGKDLLFSQDIEPRSMLINRNFVVEDDKTKGLDKGPIFTIKTQKGKEVSLAVRIPKASADGILFLTMNNEQIPIDGQQYLYFSGMKNPMFKKITIKTPDTPGEYSLNGYFVHSPWDKSSDLTAISGSIKLIVE